MTVIVTGATSFIGRAVVKALLEEGCRVVAVSRPASAGAGKLQELFEDLKKQAEAGDRFTPDTLPAGTPHAEFVKATDAMNARLDALDLSEVEIEEIEDPKE